MIYRFALCLFFLGWSSGIYAETEILSGDYQKNHTIDEIIERFTNADVLILGEEHDDVIGHQWKLELIQKASEKLKFSVSMEMLERDQQYIINEYFLDLMDEKMFRENMRLWNNWIDYKPIFELAKGKQIPVIASNAPRRYVRAISRNGREKWKDFLPISYLYLPDMREVQLHRQKDYEDKFLSLMGMSSEHASKMDNFLLAQHIWDESMAECIDRAIQTENTKVIHINGRFHSDQFFGVSHRLIQKKRKILTISILPKERLEKSDVKLADFVVLTSGK